MAIRPFRFGDVVLVQRLLRYATQLNIEKTLLCPQSPLWTALGAFLPWGRTGTMTYVLRQDDNGLVRAGFVQIQQRPGRPEADVLLVSPALDAPQGHPALWHKLLAQSAQALVHRHITRLYSDLPNQPLLVNTFRQAGFSLYTRETIWRFILSPQAQSFASSTYIRPQCPEDERGLQQLYAHTTPRLVRQAEGDLCTEDVQTTNHKPPILARPSGGHMSSYVLDTAGSIEGCVQIVWGRNGSWLRLWVDTRQVDNQAIHVLLRHGLSEAARRPRHTPLYIGVRDYHGGLSPVLSEYGFAPFTDRARMVKQILQWAREPASQRLPALEAVREAVPGSLVVPKSTGQPAKTPSVTACMEEGTS